MKCEQARDMLLNKLDGEGAIQAMPDLDEHLKGCPACQEWYRRQQVAAAAVEKLEPVRVPPNFTARVLAHLPEIKPGTLPGREARGGVPALLRHTWRDLLDSLSTPAGRRRLAPALVTAAAVLIVAVCLLAIVQGGGVPVTPGAAAGSPAGVILASGVAVVLLAALGLLLLRRK
jgi:hypothetical protein